MKKVFTPIKSAFTLLASASVCCLSGQTLAYEKGDWVVRAGVVHVAPEGESGGVAVPALGVGPIAGTGVEPSNDTRVGFTATYMLSNSLGVEAIGAPPFTHDITADLSVAGFGKVDAGKVTQLPPIVSLVWYPLTSQKTVSPYVGLGLNYTMFWDEKASPTLEATVPLVAQALGTDLGVSRLPLNLQVKNSWGVAVQAGVDVALNDRWHLNASVRWVDIDTKATLKSDGVTIITVDDIEIDPLVYQFNVGYRF